MYLGCANCAKRCKKISVRRDEGRSCQNLASQVNQSNAEILLLRTDRFVGYYYIETTFFKLNNYFILDLWVKPYKPARIFDVFGGHIVQPPTKVLRKLICCNVMKFIFLGLLSGISQCTRSIYSLKESLFSVSLFLIRFSQNTNFTTN